MGKESRERKERGSGNRGFGGRSGGRSGGYGGRSGGSGGRSGGRSGGYGGRSDRGPSGFRPRSDRPVEMHDATCSNCGAECQVPFRPTGVKPVLCRNCYNKDDSRSSSRGSSNRSSGVSSEQMELINTKLDHILEILQDLTIDDKSNDSAE